MKALAILSLPMLLFISSCGSQEQSTPASTLPDNTVHADDALRRSMGIAVAVVEEQRLPWTISCPAVVQPLPDRHARIGSLIEGRIQKVFVSEGDPVKPGQALATIESAELAGMVAELIRARAEATAANTEFERTQSLVRQNAASDKQLTAARAAMETARATWRAARTRLAGIGMRGEDLTRIEEAPTDVAPVLTLRSPIAGRVTRREATLGQNTTVGMDLFEIVDLSTVLVEGKVYEADFPALAEGLPARFQTMDPGTPAGEGRITAIGGALDPESHTLPVYMRLANPSRMFRPHQYGRLEIHSKQEKALVSVSKDALVFDGNDTFVFVRVNDSTFAYRKVEAGAEIGDHIAIRSGLQAGETVVTAGVFNLKSQFKLSQMKDE